MCPGSALSRLSDAEAAAAREHADAGLGDAGEGAVIEGLVEVAHLPQLVAGPALAHAVLVASRAPRAEVSPLRSASKIVSAASIPDFIARWMPLSRWPLTKPPLSPMSRKPSPESFGIDHQPPSGMALAP